MNYPENEIEEESNYESYYDEGSGCRKECCLVTRNEPYHLVNISSSTKKHGKQKRSIQRSWLMYCTTRNSLYCFHCRRKNRNGGFAFGPKFKDAFVTTGFNN